MTNASSLPSRSQHLLGSLGLAMIAGLYAIACSGGESGTGSSSGTSGNAPSATTPGSSQDPSDPGAGTPGTSTPSAPSAPASNAPSCKDEDDCPNWFCDCEEGPPVNTRHCTNNTCEDASVACPKSCKSFGTCWTGQAGGGWDGGTNAGVNDCKPPVTPDAGAGSGCGDGTAFADLGKGCTVGTQCESGQCWGVNPSYACTKRCTTAQQCPKSWECVPSGQGFSICLQGDKANTTPSTNASCAQISFSDLGGGCTQPTNCQSLICLGQSYCSRRCDVAADCPTGWSCKKGASFDYCIK